ncbi:MAG: hypothetical protein ACREGD_01070 [Candidatus Saccharimonadales bacterium]
MRQRGFTALEAVIILVVVMLLGLGAWFVLAKNNNSNEGSSNVTWNFDGSDWQAGATPPTCPDPLVFPYTPVDAALVSSLLFPGQYRGNHYKAHGGFRFDGSKASDISVRLPMDAQLTGLTRYLEGGELQYLATFTNSCGIMLRFDHLSTLSHDLQAVAETAAEPKEGDTRGLPIENGPMFKAGEVIATAVGLPEQENIFVDFGVYDLRTPNQISQNQDWAYIHAPEKEQTYYGVCWFDMLPDPAKSAVHKLAMLQADEGEVSDYCDISKVTTLD